MKTERNVEMMGWDMRGGREMKGVRKPLSLLTRLGKLCVYVVVVVGVFLKASQLGFCPVHFVL